MNPSTSLGTRSNVGMAKPSPPVRQAGNIGSLLMIRGVCRRKVPSGGAQVKSKCRCRANVLFSSFLIGQRLSRHKSPLLIMGAMVTLASRLLVPVLGFNHQHIKHLAHISLG